MVKVVMGMSGIINAYSFTRWQNMWLGMMKGVMRMLRIIDTLLLTAGQNDLLWFVSRKYG